MKTNLATGQDFSPEQLNKALQDVEDLLQRALCPFVLLGETARSLYDGFELSGKQITIGVQKKYLTREVISTITTLMPNAGLSAYGFAYEVGGVPIVVKFISRNYKFLKNPDHTFHMASEYAIPNPFENYWKARFIVK